MSWMGGVEDEWYVSEGWFALTFCSASTVLMLTAARPANSSSSLAARVLAALATVSREMRSWMVASARVWI